ncbi:MAG: Stp1/IreP family PP2C-type Ser/Thr phosphatase [Gammaproteobacteria bacterium]|nr:Stp1/IreP family PP2C-type Ser/Thr phosphatase [Gammaproteobacteria bacterium]
MSVLLMYGLTDTGRKREQNEDCIALVPEAGLVIVADGMGGHQAGEVASKLAVDSIAKYVVDSFIDSAKAPNPALEIKSVGEAVQQANRAIYELSRQRPECAGMGSTVVTVVFYDDKLCVGHVGDSRLYRFRFGILEQITQDHSVIQELVSRGLATEEEARESVSKNLVTRALGIDPAVLPDISEHNVMDEDIYLLCSDGLNDVLADGDIEMILTEHGRSLQTAAQTMVETANARGGPDNISVILVRTGQNFLRHKEALLKGQKADEEI